MPNTISIANILELLQNDSVNARETIIEMKKGGEFPRLILPILRDILACYFENGRVCLYEPAIEKYPQLPGLIETLFDELSRLDSNDFCYLLSQILNSGDRKLYFADIFKKLLDRNLHEIKHELHSLARYLVLFDPSVVVDSSGLLHLYRKQSVGTYVNFLDFETKWLPLLLKNAEPEILVLLNQFKARLRTEKFIPSAPLNERVISHLAEVYRLRWLLIKGTSAEYTRVQKFPEVNGPWIFVAQLLCGAKLIPSNYYRFLMPTLEHDVDFVTKEPLVNYALSHFVLSDDGKSLILLDSSAEYFRCDKDKIVFCNRSVFPARPFTNKEREQIKYAAERFRDCLEGESKFIPVQRSTIYLVLELLTSSLRKNISNSDLDLAYLDFCEKLSLLDPEELNRLHAQQISWNGSRYTFFEILSTIALGDSLKGCTTELGKYLLKWVIDYLPAVELPFEIMNIARVRDMRIQSEKHKSSDDFNLSSVERKKRFHLLKLSFEKFPFVTHKFVLSQRYSPEYSSIVSGIQNKDIFCLIREVVYNEQLDDPFFDIIEKIIVPLLISGSIQYLPDDLRHYLDWVRSEYFYSFTFPQQLFLALQKLPANHLQNPSIQWLQKKIIQGMVQNVSESGQCISVHLAFMNFRDRLLSSESSGLIFKLLLKELKNVKYLMPPKELRNDFYVSICEYLMNSQGEAVQKRSPGPEFFTSSPKRKKKNLSPLLEHSLHSVNSVEDIFRILEDHRVASSGRRGRSDSLPTYLEILQHYKSSDLSTSVSHGFKL